jgi:hypothetical protein
MIQGMDASSGATELEGRLGVAIARGVGGWHGKSPVLAAARLTGALSAPTGAESAVWLSRIPAHGLAADDLVRRVVLADRVAAWAQAQAATALADYVGAGSGSVEAETDLRFEVRVARRGTDNAAGHDIATARMLAGVARPVRDLWEAGRISQRHVHAVLDRVARVDDALAATVMPAVIARLPRLSSNDVGRTVSRLLSRSDPGAMATAAQQARRHDVGVRMRALPDGLAEIVATLQVEDAREVVEVLDSRTGRFLTHRRSCDGCSRAVPDEIGPARARAFLSLVLGTSDAVGEAPTDTTPTTRPSRRRARLRGETQVVIDLPTLLGLAENPGLLGTEPVPAAIARELAASTGSLRRIVTDPLTGHLLDYGTRTYLPDALREYVIARDSTCTSPGCRQPAARSQLDHIVPFPNGPSDPANTHMHCKRDHDLKGRGTLILDTHEADGSATWRTRDGQHGVTPVRPYLNPPDEIPSKEIPLDVISPEEVPPF